MTRLALILFLPLLLSAQPEIIALRYSPSPPVVDGVEYSPDSPQVYWEFYDDSTNVTGTIRLGTRAVVSLTWTATAGHDYAVQSSPSFLDWRTPFVRNSPWLAATTNTVSWTGGVVDGQRFYRVVER